MSEDMRDMLDALRAADVHFLVVGAFAMAAHGVPRATGDIDLFIDATPENAARLIEALRDFGAPLDQHGVTAADFERPGRVYQIGLPPNRIDILTRIDGLTFAEAARDALPATLFGVAVRVPSLRAIIANKTASGRPKDLVDVEVLRSRLAD
jgi:hypothetical protein